MISLERIGELATDALNVRREDDEELRIADVAGTDPVPIATFNANGVINTMKNRMSNPYRRTRCESNARAERCHGIASGWW